MRRLSCLGALLCLVAFVLPLTAQLPIGSIARIAKDPSGRLITGAHVVANDEHQATVRQGLTNDDGAFTLSNIEPGASTSVQSNFYQADTIAGGYFGSGGAHAFQLAARLEF